MYRTGHAVLYIYEQPSSVVRCTGHAVLHIYEQPGSVVRSTVQDMLYCIYNSLAVWLDVPYRTCSTAYLTAQQCGQMYSTGHAVLHILTTWQCGHMYHTGHAVLHIYQKPDSVVRCTVQDMLYCRYMYNITRHTALLLWKLNTAYQIWYMFFFWWKGNLPSQEDESLFIFASLKIKGIFLQGIFI